MLEGNINSVGTAIKWAVDSELTTYEEINNITPEGDIDPDLYFVPALSGLSTPFHNASARGLFIGLNHNSTRLDMVRSILESMALRIQQITTSLNSDTGFSITQLSVDGGVSQNDYILQSIANYTGLRTVRATDIEKTSLGAAFLAGLHIGFWKDQNEIKSLLRNERSFTCEYSVEKRKARYMRFNTACERAKDWLRGSPKSESRFYQLFKMSSIISFIIGMYVCYLLLPLIN